MLGSLASGAGGSEAKESYPPSLARWPLSVTVDSVFLEGDLQMDFAAIGRAMLFRAMIVIAAAGSAASAQEDAVEKFRDYLPEQIMAMSEEERRSSVPMLYVYVAETATSPTGDLALQVYLNRLMYTGIGDFDPAKKAFQKDLGEEPTGDLTVWQIHQLQYRASRSTMTSVSFFPHDFGGFINDTWGLVEGTLKILGEKIAYPINHVKIECSRNQGTCTYRQIALMLPDENSWAQTYHLSEIADETYRITRWENNQIDAVPLREAGCRTNQLNLNFETQEFYEIARNNTEGDCDTGLGASFPRLEKPRISQIVDGRDIVDAEFRKIGDEAYEYLSSEFRAKIDALAEK